MRLHRLVLTLERGIAASLMLVLFLLVLVQVTSRYIYFMPMTWTEELARYTMIWLTFVAAAYVTTGDGHISINLADRVLRKELLRWYVIVARLVVFAACLLMVPGAWRFVRAMMNVNTPASNIPAGLVYAAALTGIVLIGLHSLVSAYLIWKKEIDPAAPPELMDTGSEQN
jgi:TRAP-type transport system small permease protein